MNASEILSQLQQQVSLNAKQVELLAEGLLGEALTEIEKADLLRALANKGESVEEIVGFVRAFLRHAIHPDLDIDDLGPAIDVCGTGGDKLDLFNISTTTMFVLAGAGITVVKHGNRGVTSKSGGADVLEALGIQIDLTPEQFSACVLQTGAGFMFAPHYHPAFKVIAPVRKRLAAEGTRTIFNLIGPLLNPVQPYFQLVGLADGKLPRMYAEILHELGRIRAWAVHGSTQEGYGMDELSTLGPSKIAEVTMGKIYESTLQPTDLKLTPAHLGELKGGDAATNAEILTGILTGEIKGPKRDIVMVNAAAGLQITGQASSWSEALALANQILDDGKALKALRAVQEFSRSQEGR
jgi:anthranilate phosphoribosyltransferase